MKNFLATLSESGLVFMTPTVNKGRAGIQAAFSNGRVTDADGTLVVDKILGISR